MDDPLKPKTVPLAAETVLWFEFLLDPEFITKHLQKQNPEPSPVELIAQFITMTPNGAPLPNNEVLTPGSELQVIPGGIVTGAPPVLSSIMPPPPLPPPPPTDGLYLTRKQLALKILELKVATWLKWDLDLLESKLPVPIQLHLLRDLCTLSFGRSLNIPLGADFEPTITRDGNERAARFALVIYHRMRVRLHPILDAVLKPPRLNNNVGPQYELLRQFYETPVQASLDFLHDLCGKSNEPFYVLNYDTFVTLHQDFTDHSQNYDIMPSISAAELRAQISFDLANFYLYTRQNQLARETAHASVQNLNEARRVYQVCNMCEENFKFCHLNPTVLEGLLMACGISQKPISLLERFNQSQLNGYKDIVQILKLDNRAREIPLVTRRNMELNIEAKISLGILKEPRELEVQVAALNVLRNIFEWGNIFGNVDYFEKYSTLNCYPPIVDAIHDVLPHCNHNDMITLKHFLIDCILSHENGNILLMQVHDIGIFTTAELNDLEQQLSEEDLPKSTLATLSDWQCQSNLPSIAIGGIERQLISCTNANTVRVLLVKLAASAIAKPLWTVNPSWEIPTPLKSLLITMQRSFHQDFAYVLLGKARELACKGDYINAVSMLSVLKSETQRYELQNATVASKLSKLVTWEILHIQITQCLEEWHQKPLDIQSLNTRCKQCLASIQNSDTAIPRIEIIESCTMMLLNLAEWQTIILLDKRLSQLELPILFASAFIEMEKMKGPKKACRDVWELVLSMFLNTTKRTGGNVAVGVSNAAATASGGSSGGGGGGGGSSNSNSSRNSPCLAVSNTLQPFLKRLRHQSLFGLAISILGKIHNILKDDPNHDLICEYIQFWPTSISNPISYSLRLVCETLQWLLTEALRYYPQTITWLKIKGDLELAIGNNESAMRSYVNSLVTATDYCTVPLQRNIADDYIIRKMIRCAANLGCHTQATVLCQFLDEVDYGIVFKNLSEKSSNFTDAMDAYYSCIWDTTLLEFIINLHGKRGEHSRKNEACTIMGTLELNANNNEEIKREAAAIRKARFLRALAKQYLL